MGRAHFVPNESGEWHGLCFSILRMSKEEDNPRFDAKLAEGVAYFERMLEIMPEDRTTLEFLVVAYEQLGEDDKCRKALVGLANLLVKEGDVEALRGLLPRLQASDYEPAKILALKVSRLTAPEPDLTPERPKELTAAERTAQAAKDAVGAEKALADLLQEGGVLDGDAHKALCGHLVSVPADGRLFLISAIQILEKENPNAAERAIEHLADRFGTPPVPLAAFDPDRKIVGLVPAELARMRGVVPFAKLGKTTLVASLNPADERLRAAVEAAVGPHRTFLADPSAVESVLGKVYGEAGGT